MKGDLGRYRNQKAYRDGWGRVFGNKHEWNYLDNGGVWRLSNAENAVPYCQGPGILIYSSDEGTWLSVTRARRDDAK